MWTSFTGRFESGVPMELPDLDPDELRQLPGSELVNFDTGRVKPWYVFGCPGGMDLVRKERFTVGAQMDIQNLADRHSHSTGATRFRARTSDTQD